MRSDILPSHCVLPHMTLCWRPPWFTVNALCDSMIPAVPQMRRTEAPQLVSTESILGFMDAMQLREVGKLVV